MAKRLVRQLAEVSTTLAEPLPGEAEVDTMLVGQAVEELNRLYTVKGLETARSIGEYVVGKFFGGNEDNFSRARDSHKSFGALAEHEGLRVSKSFLWYSVNLLPQLKLLPEDIAVSLPLSHHRLLLHVGDPKAKKRLAEKAVERGMSKREFEAEIKKTKDKDGSTSKAGRKPLPAFQRTIHRFRTILDDAETAFGDLEKVEGLSENDATTLYQTVTGMKLKCEELQKVLQPRVTGFRVG